MTTATMHYASESNLLKDLPTWEAIDWEVRQIVTYYSNEDSSPSFLVIYATVEETP